MNAIVTGVVTFDTPLGPLVITPIVAIGAFMIGRAIWNGIQSDSARRQAEKQDAASVRLAEQLRNQHAPQPPEPAPPGPCPRCGSRNQPKVSLDPQLGLSRRVCSDCGQILTD